MGSKDVRAGGAYVELLTKDAALRKGLDAASKTLQKWGNGINALGKTFLKIGTAALAPLAATSKVFASMGDEMAKTSTRTGVSVEAISALAYAAKQSGTDLEGLELGLRKMSKLVVEAAKGGGAAVETLRLLGLTVENLKGLSPDQQFKAIAEQISKVQDPTLKAALAMEVFGKSGTSLIPLMNEGAKGIEELEARAKALGLTWTTVDAKAAEEFGDRLDDLWQVMKRTTATVGSALAPVMRTLAVTVTDNVVKLKKWVDGHREVVVTALKVAVGVVAAGAAFVVLGRGIAIIGSVVGGVSTALGLLGSAASIAGTILSTVLFSGIGLTIAALGGLAAYLIYSSDVGQKALGALGNYFGDLSKTAKTAFDGIVDAMKAGDWQLAAQILWAGLRAAWLEGIQPLREAWETFTTWMATTWNDLSTGASAAWIIISDNFARAWAEMTAVATYAWNSFTDGIKQVWEGTQSWLESQWLKLFNKFGMLSDAELEAAAAMATKQTGVNTQGIVEESQKNEAAIFKALNEARAAHPGIGKGGPADEALAALAGENQAANATAKSDAAAKIAAAKAETEAAKTKLDVLRKSAGTAAAAASAAPNFPKAPVFNAGDVAAGLDDVMKKTIGVTGTFNPAAVQGLGTGAVGERIAKATEETAKGVKKLASGGSNPRFG